MKVWPPSETHKRKSNLLIFGNPNGSRLDKAAIGTRGIDLKEPHNLLRLHQIPCSLPHLAFFDTKNPTPPSSPNPMASNQPCYSTFFNLQNNRVHYLLNTFPNCSSRNRLCGSSHGWLVVLGECPNNICLENPLTETKLELPPLNSFPNAVSFNYAKIGLEYVIQGPDGRLSTDSLSHMRDCFIKKVVLSSSPMHNPDFTALAVLNCTDKLAFCKGGSHCWTFIDIANFYPEDSIYKNGSFYTINKSGRVAVCDVRGPSPKVSVIETGRIFGSDVQEMTYCSLQGT